MDDGSSPAKRDQTHTAATTLKAALFLASRGFKVFPCRPGDKRPATINGLLDASTDEAEIRRWFGNDRGYNLAVACGPQPNDVNLLAVDIDPVKGGDSTWSALLNGHQVPPGPTHTTRSNGTHLFFDAPVDLRNTSGRLGVGIDTRGAGGYVVVPPSQVADAETGEIGHYTTTRSTMLGGVPVPPLPDWLGEMLDDQSEAVARHPSSAGGLLDLGDSVADKLRTYWVWEIELESDGWVRNWGGRGDEERWTRPDKNPRDGHSAVLHLPDGPFVVWSTERPAGGKTNIDGSSSFSPWDYLKAYRGGDNDRRTAELAYEIIPRRAAAIIRGEPSPQPGPTSKRAVNEAGEDHDTPLFPPELFYEQRPWLAACRQMAQASGIAPAPMVLAFMTRWATLIPPGFSIPAINGARSSFDLIGVVAGTSGSGKSSVMARAAEMLPIARKDLRVGLGIGSGEGVIEAFYASAPVVGEDGKSRKERAKVIAGVHFAVDEGMLLAELSGRAGTTHITRLCTAWSGGILSTANASAESFRHIDTGQYRLTAMMGIQADRAHEMMTDSLASQGFVGRLLFTWAEEPPVRPRPDEPEPFVLKVPDAIRGGGQYLPTVLTYPQAVWNELIDRHDARRGQVVPVEEHHHDLQRLKVAGTFALMDGRFEVTADDWALATIFVDCSANVRRHLYAHRRQRDQQTRVTKQIARAEDEEIFDNHRERQKIAELAETIRVKVKAKNGMSRSALRKAVTSGDTRPRFDRALDLARGNGWVRFLGHRIEPVD